MNDHLIVPKWLWRWILLRQCGARYPLDKKSFACCTRHRFHFGAHRDWSGKWAPHSSGVVTK